MILRISYFLLCTLFVISCASENSSEINTKNGNQTIQYNDFENQNREFIHTGELKFIQPTDDKALVVQRIEKIENNIAFTIDLIPNELFLKNKGLRGDRLLNALQETQDELIFYLDIQSLLSKDVIKEYQEENYDETINYLNGEVLNDFELFIDNSESKKPDYVMLERDYGISPYERLILGFSGLSDYNSLNVVFSDRLFTKKKIKFEFANQNLLNQNLAVYDTENKK